MKLRAIDTRPPQQVRVTVDGATYEKLLAYLDYARAQGQVFEDLRQLLAEIARAFIDGGDKGFTAWYRARHATDSPSPARLRPTPAHGHEKARDGDERRRAVRLTTDGATTFSEVKGEAAESGEGDRKPV
jgi:hypothetical protein